MPGADYVLRAARCCVLRAARCALLLPLAAAAAPRASASG
jgi:hypothetical protein